MKFEDCLINHINMHPMLQCRDIIKFCFQAAFGAEHLLSDIERAKEYFYKEYDNTPSEEMPLYEELNDDFCRVNIAAWKENGLDKDLLFKIFVDSAKESHIGNRDEIFLYFKNVSDVLNASENGILIKEWETEVARYLETGLIPVHHSDVYRNEYLPSYRVVKTEFLKFIGEKEDVIKDEKL